VGWREEVIAFDVRGEEGEKGLVILLIASEDDRYWMDEHCGR
jgi:hypothetical protein